MLANGSMPMLSTAAPADSRLATAGDMLSLPDDRRNLAPASSSPAAVTAGNEAHESPPSTITSITSAAETEEPQQDGGRTASPAPPPPPPPPPPIAARKEEGGPSLCSATQSPPPCALDPRSSERKITWEGGGSSSSSSSTNYYCNNIRLSSDAVKTSVVNEPNANVVAPPRAAEVIAPSTEHASCVSSEVVPPLPQQQQQQLRKQPTPPNVPRPAKSNSSVAEPDKDSITTHVPNATTTIAATTDSDETSGPPLPQPAVSTATAVAITPANTTSGAPTPAAASSIVNGNGARQDSKMGPTSTHVEKVQIDSPLAGQHDVVDKRNGGGDHVGMEVDEEGPREHVPRGAAVAPSSLLLVAGANNVVVSSATAQGCAEKGGTQAVAARHETDTDKVEVCRQRLERLAGGGVGPAAAAAAAASGDDVVDIRVVKREESVQHEQASAEMQALNASFPPRNSVLEDSPLGEGWDDQGRDLSKASNDAIRRAQCEAWTAKLRQEASLIRAGDHPEVVRRSVLTDTSSKRRLDMSERNAKRQRSTVERLYQLEMQSIKASYDAAVAQTRERLTVEVNEELRRSKSRMEGFKEVENRMNTRHTRGTAKGSIEDPWLPQATGAKSNGNSKRPLCPVALVLEDDALAEDIEFLRYAPHGNNGGGGAGSGYNGGYGDAMPQGVSGRSRRPPAWRRDD